MSLAIYFERVSIGTRTVLRSETYKLLSCCVIVTFSEEKIFNH